MQHILDNPAWHALNSGNAALALGTEHVKYFPENVSPFVGLRENSEEHMRTLHGLMPSQASFGLISPIEMELPPQWTLLQRVDVFQMIVNQPAGEPVHYPGLRPLTVSDIPAMLELTALTRPGPFSGNTIAFGHYQGIFDGEKLVAMAGQRLNPSPYAEISAVCTLPDYLGKGLAAALLRSQVYRIQQAGGTPILHVKDDNERAIALYTRIGFVIRKSLFFYIIKKRT